MLPGERVPSFMKRVLPVKTLLATVMRPGLNRGSSRPLSLHSFVRSSVGFRQSLQALYPSLRDKQKGKAQKLLFELILGSYEITGLCLRPGKTQPGLTCCTLSGFHRWLCVECRIGSPGQCVSLRSDRPLPPCRSHRSARSAETPEETLHASQRI